MLSGRGQSRLGMRRWAQREGVAQLRSPSRQGQCLSLLHPTYVQRNKPRFRGHPGTCPRTASGPKALPWLLPFWPLKSNCPASKCLWSLPVPVGLSSLGLGKSKAENNETQKELPKAQQVPLF